HDAPAEDSDSRNADRGAPVSDLAPRPARSAATPIYGDPGKVKSRSSNVLAGARMLQGWVVIAVALAYIGLLFLVASYGDQTRGMGCEGRARLLIYPLSLAIYCTSWTFFGSVGSASRTG